MYRYWDGAAWTDHRSPKAGPPAYVDNSGTGIIGAGWELFRDNWVPLLAIGALTFVGVVVGVALIGVAVVSALDPDVFDIIERVTRSDFNPDIDPVDQAYLDNIDFNLTPTFVVAALAGFLVIWLVALVGAGSATMLLGGRHHGEPIGVGQALGLAIRRFPRWLGIVLLWSLVGGLPILLLWVLALAAAPILLVLVIPATIGAVIYLFPIMSIAGAGLFLGPVDRPPFRTAFAIVKPQWGTVAVRVLVINLILFAINLGLGLIGAIPILGIFVSIVGQFVYYGLQTGASVKLYASVDGPFTEELAPGTEPWELPSAAL